MKLFTGMFKSRFFLTPVALLLEDRTIKSGGFISFRTLYIFGIRVAYWTVKGCG